IVGFLFTGILSSCTENEMDRINKNTSTPPVSSVDARFQLSDAIMSMAFMTYGGSYAWHVASYTEQIFGDGGNQMMFAELRDPIITAAPTTFNNEWNNTYRNLLSIDIIIQKCENGVNRGQLDIMGIGRVLKVMGFQALTDLHGDIPFSEALNDGIRNPKLDKQEFIYSSLINEIDLAIENLSAAIDKQMSNGGRQDILYGGDTKKWLALAYAVKARLYLNESAKIQDALSSALSSAQLALDNGFEGADLSIFNGVEATNSWAAYFKSRHYSGACNTVVSLMETREDPRLSLYASDLFSSGIVSAPAGDATLSATIDNVGGPLWLKNQSASIHLLSKASLYFIIAECKARKNQDFSNELNEGIRASMTDYSLSCSKNIDNTDIENYIANLPEYSLKEVMIQKYISQTRDEQIETYNDMRRCRALGEEFIKLQNPNNNNNGQNRWPYSLPYGNSDVVSNPNVTKVFGTGNNAGYYIFERSLWLFSN
ncbi:MAG: SusD/RagB family nutrient-binding outer membrane lipoprotein, partial [Muribaculaceae bacterium]|nr:SusD/RagB family nutrient-binding outer membrane lipoprotein [Muribaculaceae bacterium]